MLKLDFRNMYVVNHVLVQTYKNGEIVSEE
jgi:hypothetical protein